MIAGPGKHGPAQEPSRDGSWFLRPARPDDHDAVVELVFSILRSFGIEPEPEGLDSDVMRFGELSPSVGEYVIEADGRIVGSIALRDRGDGTGHISKFFVDACMRGRGAGRALLDAAVTDAKARGLRILDLETRSQFEAAIHLYESTGWKRGPEPQGVCDRTYTLEL